MQDKSAIRRSLAVLVPVLILAFWARLEPVLADPSSPVLIDIGHDPVASGATSAFGDSEYAYNRRFAEALSAALGEAGIAVDIVNPEGRAISLDDRRVAILGRDPSLMISVHHDSVQQRYLEEWSPGGRPQRYSDRFRGFSLFVSARAPAYDASRRLAEDIADALLVAGETPSHHHAEPIEGENRPLLDPARGLYRFDGLAVLRSNPFPSVLLEVGIIVNRKEAERLADPAEIARLARAVASGIEASLDSPAGGASR